MLLFSLKNLLSFSLLFSCILPVFFLPLLIYSHSLIKCCREFFFFINPGPVLTSPFLQKSDLIFTGCLKQHALIYIEQDNLHSYLSKHLSGMKHKHWHTVSWCKHLWGFIAHFIVWLHSLFCLTGGHKSKQTYFMVLFLMSHFRHWHEAFPVDAVV